VVVSVFARAAASVAGRRDLLRVQRRTKSVVAQDPDGREFGKECWTDAVASFKR
jgi:hypothetical protein